MAGKNGEGAAPAAQMPIVKQSRSGCVEGSPDLVGNGKAGR